jgi:LCP family protein required for cell wall assembly
VTDTLPRLEPTSRRERRRRRLLRRRAVLGAAGLAALATLAALAFLRPGGGPAPRPPVAGAAEGEQVTYLLVGVRSGNETGAANWLTLFAVDRAGRRPVAVFLPTAALVEVPGFGFDALGKAMALGGVRLQTLAVANALGIGIDHTAVVSDDLLAAIVDAAGGVEVTVPGRLLAAEGADRMVPAFEPGRQRLDGRRAVAYLAYRGPGEDELARIVRQQQLWEALAARFAGARSEELRRIVAGLGDRVVSDASPAEVGSFLASFLAADPAARTYRTLAVAPVGTAGPGEAFRLDEEGTAELVEALLGPSRPPPGPGVGARVQVLNGTGVPQIGVAVASRLVPAGFRIADSGNASSFDFRRTRIVVYREEDLAVGERVRALLGVGEVEIGRTPQSVVDVTIVVGDDFAGR